MQSSEIVLGKVKLPHANLCLFCVKIIVSSEKNMFVFFFGNHTISKWRSFEKWAILLYRYKFLVTGERHKISFSTYLTCIHVFCSPYLLFFGYPILRFYHVWFLFSATPGVDSYSRHFGAINK